MQRVSCVSKLILIGISFFSVLNVLLFYCITFDDRSVSPSFSSSFSSRVAQQLLAFTVSIGSPNPPLNANENASTVAFDDALSACLLVKDDNLILSQWVAYHYYTMNLRYLVVAVDPTSTTSPSHVLKAWTAHTDLHAEIWTDKDYMPESFDGRQIRNRFIRTGRWHNGTEDQDQIQQDNLRISNHRFRQLRFLSSCLSDMRMQKRTLVMHVDTDEYVTLNPLLRYRSTYRTWTMPSLSYPGAISSFIQQILYQDDFLFQKANFPCVSMPRLLFGSVEDDRDEMEERQLQHSYNWLNASRFETLRWKYHAAYNDTMRNAQPKVLVDLRLIPPDDQMFHNAFSIHRPSKTLCRYKDQMLVTGFQRYPLIVQHYVGTLERYLMRSDSRRSERLYHEKAHVSDGGRDAWIVDWLPGFVRSMGEARARFLLGLS